MTMLFRNGDTTIEVMMHLSNCDSSSGVRRATCDGFYIMNMVGSEVTAQAMRKELNRRFAGKDWSEVNKFYLAAMPAAQLDLAYEKVPCLPWQPCPKSPTGEHRWELFPMHDGKIDIPASLHGTVGAFCMYCEIPKPEAA